MDTATLLGYLATSCTTFAFLPQVIRTWRTKKADDLSLGMLAVYITGILLWIAYGFALNGGTFVGNGTPVIVGNVVALVLVGLNTYMAVRFRSR